MLLFTLWSKPDHPLSNSNSITYQATQTMRMRNDTAAGFENLNTMMEKKPVVVLIHVWKDNTQYCSDFTVVSSTITHHDIITGDFNAPSSQRSCARTIPMCQLTEECQSSQPARSLVMQPDQLALPITQICGRSLPWYSITVIIILAGLASRHHPELCAF